MLVYSDVYGVNDKSVSPTFLNPVSFGIARTVLCRVRTRWCFRFSRQWEGNSGNVMEGQESGEWEWIF